jgi:hypothetical protein
MSFKKIFIFSHALLCVAYASVIYTMDTEKKLKVSPNPTVSTSPIDRTSA